MSTLDSASADPRDTAAVHTDNDPNQNALFATYYAVPVKRPGTSAESDIERCLYFNSGWFAVPSNALKAADDQDLVRIRQVAPEAVPEHVVGYIKTSGYEITKSVGLYTATARTLNMVEDPVSTQMMALEGNYYDRHGAHRARSVVIPVVSTTRRGVILIFKFPATGETTRLIASADPEVENGSSN